MSLGFLANTRGNSAFSPHFSMEKSADIRMALPARRLRRCGAASPCCCGCCGCGFAPRQAAAEVDGDGRGGHRGGWQAAGDEQRQRRGRAHAARCAVASGSAKPPGQLQNPSGQLDLDLGTPTPPRRPLRTSLTGGGWWAACGSWISFPGPARSATRPARQRSGAASRACAAQPERTAAQDRRVHEEPPHLALRDIGPRPHPHPGGRRGQLQRTNRGRRGCEQPLIHGR